MLTARTEAARALPLTRFIEDLRVPTPEDGKLRHEWLPDGRVSLVLRVLDGGRRGDVSLAGPRTRAQVKDLSGVCRAAIIRFKPGWTSPLFGVAANEVTDRIVPLERIWGPAGSDLYEELLEAEDTTALLACVSSALTSRALRSFESSTAHVARRAARLLDGGEPRVDRVAARIGVTDRHLRRAFAEHVGVSPKEYARSARLQRAVRSTSSSNDWGRIALESGFYDQAHFIADFHQLTGVTPGAFARGSRVAALRCL